MQGSLNQYILRILAFLFIIVLVVVFIYPVLQSALLSNIYINLIIVFSLFFGIAFCLYNLNKLQNDYSILADWSYDS